MSARDLTTLSHEYRRTIIELLEDEESATVDDVIAHCVAETTDSEREVRATLYHNHLPSLETSGAIEWEDDTTITTGSRFQQFASNIDNVRAIVA